MASVPSELLFLGRLLSSFGKLLLPLSFPFGKLSSLSTLEAASMLLIALRVSRSSCVSQSNVSNSWLEYSLESSNFSSNGLFLYCDELLIFRICEGNVHDVCWIRT